MWTAQNLRESYLKFFEEKGHRIVPSSSLIIKEDPSLLFTTAGMVQFKPLYSGKVPLPYTRAVSCQKCLRATDLEKVGKTIKHHTFFEMLGNFSFGDYFKESAIEWAWEFVTNIIGFDKERLYVSVYIEDKESYDIWNKKIGLPEYKIYKLGKEDNFWGPAGKTGACGPCTEIYYDMGEEFSCGKEDCGPGCDCDRFLEFWNLVFPEFDMDENGELHPLKNKGVDTGMGLERTLFILQNKRSNYETDLFFPLIKELEKIFNRPYKNAIIPFNVMADHIRALTFAITDGAYPSNFGRGYVLRKILRRAHRFAQKISFEKPFLFKLPSKVCEIFKDTYPELIEKREFVSVLIKKEEERFLNTLSLNLPYLKEIIEKSKEKGIIDGKILFKLYDTYGFPLELIEEYAMDENVKLDTENFEIELEKQKELSRKEKIFEEKGKEWEIFIKDKSSEFIGYETLCADGEILQYRERQNGFYEIILDKTPFYAEAGGQIGDKGTIEADDFVFEVLDTQWYYGYIVHIGKLLKGKIGNKKVIAKVNEEIRKGIMRAHTSTHLLHTTLREFLGEHIRQEGSLVEPDRLRFDFTHFEKIDERIIDEIEKYIVDKIIENRPVQWEWMEFRTAIDTGALAFFQEKYGDIVRVVEIKDFSRELCGGTHVNRTGDIGIFEIVKEESISAGIRRISALTGKKAFERNKNIEKIFTRSLSILNIGKEELMLKKLERLNNDRIEYEKEIEHLEDLLANYIANSFEKIEVRDKEVYVKALFKGTKLSLLKKVSDRIFSGNKDNKVLFLVGEEKDKPVFFARVSDNISSKISAKELVREFGKFVKGGGGGTDTRAEGGGKEKKRVKQGTEYIERRIKEILYDRP